MLSSHSRPALVAIVMVALSAGLAAPAMARTSGPSGAPGGAPGGASGSGHTPPAVTRDRCAHAAYSRWPFVDHTCDDATNR